MEIYLEYPKKLLPEKRYTHNNDPKSLNNSRPELRITPLKKVSKEAVERLDHSINLSLWNELYQNHKTQKEINHSVEKKSLYTQALNKYITRICPNSECHKSLLFDTCIANCIFLRNNIQHFQLDRTSFYHIPNYGYVFTQENIRHMIKSTYPPIPDKILIKIFQINNAELHALKTQLIHNPLIKFINKYWADYSDAEKFDILLILLNPAKKRVNPVTFKRNILALSYNHELNLSDIKKILNETFDIGKIPKSYLPDNFSNEDQLTSELFNTTHRAFLEACFPKDSSDQLTQKETELLQSIPTCINNIIHEHSDQNDIAILEIAHFLLSNPNIYLFQLFPLEETELFSIFYWHQQYLLQKSFSPKQVPIFYDSPIICIRYLVAKHLLKTLPEATKIIAQNETPSEQKSLYAALQGELFKKLSLPLNIENFAHEVIPPIFSSNLKKYLSNHSSYMTLCDTLFAISDGNIQTIEKLLNLITKVYISLSLLKTLNTKSPQVTVIRCKNVNFIKQLLQNIFSYPLHSDKFSYPINEISYRSNCPHITTHPLKTLSCPENFVNFIIDKINGVIVNISSDDSFCGDLTFFKKLISGKSFSIINDPIFGKISHLNTVHYVYITESLTQIKSTFNDINYDFIDFSGNIAENSYEGLTSYECFFIILAAIYNTIDKYTQPIEDILSNNQDTLEILSPKDSINKFLADFCIDTTSKISQDDINSIQKETIEGSANDTRRKQLAKKFQIDKLDYVRRDDLYQAFNQWQSSTSVKTKNIEPTEFVNILLEKVHPIFYIKNDSANSIYEDKKHGAKVFYGLSLKKETLDSYIQEKCKEKTSISQSNIERNFLNYLENLIVKYGTSPQ